MKKFIVTIEDDVCLKNGKTEVMQADLVRKIGEYGTVEDYSTHIAKHDAVWQTKLDNMTAQYNAIAEYGVNDVELAVLKSHRVAVNSAVQSVVAENDNLKESLRKADEKAKNMSKAICDTLEAYNANE